MYKFKVGDKVKHTEYDNLTGEVVRLVTLEPNIGEILQHRDDTCPWYAVRWDHEEFEGNEAQMSLELV